jgi:hypothetical protein
MVYEFATSVLDRFRPNRLRLSPSAYTGLLEKAPRFEPTSRLS